ncbi:MAG: hypothetical protein QM820_32450 [Minicystis sp.]
MMPSTGIKSRTRSGRVSCDACNARSDGASADDTQKESEDVTEVTLETYARLLAHVACRRGVPMKEILVELGVEVEALYAAERAFRQQLAGAWEGRKGIVAMKFAAALGAALENLGPIGGEGSGSPQEQRPDEPALVAVAREPERSVPSYLQASPGPGLGSFAVQPSSAQASIVAVAPLVPLPLVPAPIAETCAGSHLAETVDADFSAIKAAMERGPLPFSSTSSTPAADKGAPTAAPHKPHAGVADAEDGTRVAARQPGSHLAGTIDADFRAIKAAMERGPLPFAHPEPSTSDEDRGEALPPLETYAGVTGSLARGEPRDEVLARHGLSAEAYDRMTKAWAQRFQREPHLLTRFQELARSSAASPRRTE